MRMLKDKQIHTPEEIKIRRATMLTVICDAALLVVFVVCLLLYVSENNKSVYNQNIDSISGITDVNASLVQTALDRSSYSINGAYKYCVGKSVSGMLEYLSTICNDDEEYQLLCLNEEVSTDSYYVYSGFSTKKKDGNYLEVVYSNTSITESIRIHAAKTNGVVSFSQSFTNRTDGLRYFSVFCGITVKENGQDLQYYLVKPQKESVLLNQTQKSSQYSNLSIAICYNDGKYLANDHSFRGDNFFDYIYKYNGLSVDQKNAIRASVQNDEDGSGVLTYLDYQKRDSVFAYSACGNEDNLIIIVSVPVSEFSSENLLSTFPLIIIGFLTILLLFNIYRLGMIVAELRRSVIRERVANAAKSNFLSRMSHEIRTPLNAIIGYNTISKNEMTGAKTDEARKHAEMKVMDCLTKSDLASKHLLTVINDVLDMSAIESGKINIAKERFDFRSLITALTTVFYTQAKTKDVQFDVLFGTLTEEWFVGDQMRINQILTNLLSNAIKFTASGGSVAMRITQPDAQNDASHIRFEISDTGIGMTPEYTSHIWTPFEQADSSISRRFGGSGLGLSITKNLIDLMGGTITVTSAPGVGSTFCVDLTFGRTAQPRATEFYDFSSLNALAVDDDPSTCDYIRLLFERCGVKCTTATSGVTAINAVKRAIDDGNPFSLCLIDWRMPDMDGIDTISQIRKTAGGDFPIIVLTAYDYSEISAKAAQLGVSRFVSKPLFQSSLFDLLSSVCGAPQDAPIKKNKEFDFTGARVLLAEDNAMNMEIAVTILKTAGLTVDSAWNGREALEMFCDAPAGTYNAILMDVHMPEMNGHDATRAIRSSGHPDAKTVPIIAMTADAFAENVAEARDAGMNGHISKPIDVTTLFRVLKEYI